MKKFIAALLFLLMLACAALAKPGYAGGLAPLPRAPFPEKTSVDLPQQQHQVKTPAQPAGVFLLSGKRQFPAPKKNFENFLKKKASSFCLHLDKVVLTHKL